MSILTGPRLNFWGGIRTDVSVPNNSPTLDHEDPKKSFNLFDLTTSTVAAEAYPYSDDELYQMMNSPYLGTRDPKAKYTSSGWNHYGQHVVDTQNALVSSQGIPGQVSTSGDLVGQPVYLLGSVDPVTGQGPFSGPMMVDLDPTSSITTQIFVGGLQIGGSASPALLIRHDTVCSSIDVAQRLLKGERDAPGSSVASGTFQLTFPLTSVVSYNKNSAILKSIIEAPNATGIVLRFVMFEMCPTMTTEQLLANYDSKQDSPNPSIGRVVGTIAPAFADEPQICPVGRQITNTGTGGTGYASVINDQMLSIDMLNVIPKQSFREDRDDITSPIGPNANYGNVSVQAGDTNLATLDPASAQLQDYYIYGGIVDLPLTAAQLSAVKSNALQISAPNKVDDTTLMATESPYRIYSDQRNIYFNGISTDANITLQLRYLGQPVTENTEIKLSASAPGVYDDNQYWNWLQYPASVTVPANQPSVSFTVTPSAGTDAQAGFTSLNYELTDSSGYFTNFRKYAQTDFGIPAGSMVTWDQVYQNVLRFHYLAFPAMSRFIPLNQEDAILNAKSGILARTSDAYLATSLYMPVVRSMSPSQTALLKAFLTNEPWQPLSA